MTKLPDICCGTCKHWGNQKKRTGTCYWMTQNSWGDDDLYPFWVKEPTHQTDKLDGQDCKGWYL